MNYSRTTIALSNLTALFIDQRDWLHLNVNLSPGKLVSILNISHSYIATIPQISCLWKYPSSSNPWLIWTDKRYTVYFTMMTSYS